MQAEVNERSYSSDNRKASISEAVALSERSLALDPQNVRALTALANALLDREGDHCSDDPAGDIARAATETAPAQPHSATKLPHCLMALARVFYDGGLSAL